LEKRQTLAFVAVLFAVSAAIFVLENPFAKPAINDQTLGPPIGTEIGRQAPKFKLQSISDAQVELKQFRGKVVVINFWASWCPYCVDEMPEFEKLRNEMGDKIVILGVNRAESLEKQNEFLNSLSAKITYTLLLDMNDDVSKSYDIRVMPTTFFLNENGVIAQKNLGSLTVAQMKQLVLKSYVAAGGGENAPLEPPKEQSVKAEIDYLEMKFLPLGAL